MNKWRIEERRSKKESFSVARENEKVQDTAVEASYSILTSTPNLSKDATKVSVFISYQFYVYAKLLKNVNYISWKIKKENWKNR